MLQLLFLSLSTCNIFLALQVWLQVNLEFHNTLTSIRTREVCVPNLIALALIVPEIYLFERSVLSLSLFFGLHRTPYAKFHSSNSYSPLDLCKELEESYCTELYCLFQVCLFMAFVFINITKQYKVFRNQLEKQCIYIFKASIQQILYLQSANFQRFTHSNRCSFLYLSLQPSLCACVCMHAFACLLQMWPDRSNYYRTNCQRCE